MYCDHIFIQILHDKLFVAYNDITPQRKEKKKIYSKKVDDIFFPFSFFGTMETRNTPLSLHYSVMSAPGRAAGRCQPLCGVNSRQVLQVCCGTISL